ncbi:polysaccharide pyruvyl transferase family protein [Hyunsoonleella sp. SJ7]|uniref:Polysaccharide pyruvyl transferase family protein n=1 Tax=Hyunsoonleella aquatilis TaxID=2762758 RepID=A0A923H9Y7_9FLAO|nr:polysaccharide pyruvyl transferase family protein [Hyunsoonleella aquatilis]MBC3757767.1 polysaccharide pyruvyl transferase family protein [Hyunsoonleella aquatilis]
MISSRKIRLFWWNEIELQGKSKENYGDLLGKYLVEKISGKEVVWTKPSAFSFSDFFSPIYVTIGSILTHVNSKCVVWGSGIVSKEFPVKNAKFLAVRGPQTRNHLLDLGYEVPKVYGDPALLLPRYYSPQVKKEYKLGIVPHYADFEAVKKFYQNDESILIIDLMTNDIETKTDQFLKCEKIISSSLHGIIVAHAYGIPAVWQKFSNRIFGDDIKYRDYFESVGIQNYESNILTSKVEEEMVLSLFKNKQTLPERNVIDTLCNGLMEVCPFNNQKE